MHMRIFIRIPFLCTNYTELWVNVFGRRQRSDYHELYGHSVQWWRLRQSLAFNAGDHNSVGVGNDYDDVRGQHESELADPCVLCAPRVHAMSQHHRAAAAPARGQGVRLAGEGADRPQRGRSAGVTAVPAAGDQCQSGAGDQLQGNGTDTVSI